MFTGLSSLRQRQRILRAFDDAPPTTGTTRGVDGGYGVDRDCADRTDSRAKLAAGALFRIDGGNQSRRPSTALKLCKPYIYALQLGLKILRFGFERLDFTSGFRGRRESGGRRRCRRRYTHPGTHTHAWPHASTHTLPTAHATSHASAAAHTSSHSAATTTAASHSTSHGHTSSHIGTCLLCTLPACSRTHTEVTGNIRTLRRRQRPRLELLNGVANVPAGADNDTNLGSVQSLVSVRPAVASEHDLYVVLSHQLRGLNACATAKREIRILDGLCFQRFGVDNEKVRTSAKPRIDLIVKRLPFGCYSDDHFSISSVLVAGYRQLLPASVF
jgi:hypothetical protein